MFPLGIMALRRDTEKHLVVARWLKAFNTARVAPWCRVENRPVHEAGERAAAPLRSAQRGWRGGWARRTRPPLRVRGFRKGPGEKGMGGKDASQGVNYSQQESSY